MRKLNNTFLLLLTSLITAIMASCSESSSPTYLRGPFEDFVTVTSRTPKQVNFSCYPQNSKIEMTLCTYETSQVSESKYPVGTRAFLTYNLTSEITSPDINVEAVQFLDIRKAIVPEPRLTTASDCTAGTEPFTVVGSPVAEEFINIKTILPHASERSFTCMVDESTADGSVMQVYLSTAIVTPATGDDKEKSTVYPISISVESLRKLGTATNIELNILTGPDGKVSKYLLAR